MADFIRYRFHGAHGATDWEHMYLPNVDDLDIEEFQYKKTEELQAMGCFNRVEVEEVAHPGNDWLLAESKRLRKRSQNCLNLAFKLESMDTGRNQKPVAHHPV